MTQKFMGNTVGSAENCQYQCNSASNNCGTCIGTPGTSGGDDAPTSAPTEATSGSDDGVKDDGVKEEVKETTTILQTVRIEITLFDVTGKTAHLLTLCRYRVCARLLSFSVSHWYKCCALTDKEHKVNCSGLLVSDPILLSQTGGAVVACSFLQFLSLCVLCASLHLTA